MTLDSDKPNQPIGNLQPHVIDFGKGNARTAPPRSAPPPSDGAPSATLSAPRAWHRYEVLGCFALMMVAIQVALGPKIRLSQWEMNADSNAAVAEGVAWMKGRLDIPPVRNNELQWDYPEVRDWERKDPEVRLHDTAYNPENHKYYNVFPPLFSILTVAVSPFHKLVGMPETMWRPEMMALLIYWPIAIVSFVTFYRRLQNPMWAAILAFALIGGTSILPGLNETRHGLLGRMDHVMSQIGLLIFAADLLGKQRIWPALVGLLIAVYSRQITILYGVVLLAVAWKRYGAKGFALAGLGLAVIVGPLLTLNYCKFGDPLEFGYRHIYAGRGDDVMGARVQKYGTFSPKYILGVDGDDGNLFYMHLSLPKMGDLSLTDIHLYDANQKGTSLWFTTPMAFWVLIAAGAWWRESNARWLMLATIPIMIVLSMYHSSGYIQHGFNRFALDFLPIWLLVVAPYSIGGRNRWRSWLTLAFAGWGLLYYSIITPDALVRPASVALQTVETMSHGQV